MLFCITRFTECWAGVTFAAVAEAAVVITGADTLAFLSILYKHFKKIIIVLSVYWRNGGWSSWNRHCWISCYDRSCCCCCHCCCSWWCCWVMLCIWCIGTFLWYDCNASRRLLLLLLLLLMSIAVIRSRRSCWWWYIAVASRLCIGNIAVLITARCRRQYCSNWRTFGVATRRWNFERRAQRTRIRLLPRIAASNRITTRWSFRSLYRFSLLLLLKLLRRWK